MLVEIHGLVVEEQLKATSLIRSTSPLIDYEAIDEDSFSASEAVLSETETDRVFINDDSELSVYSSDEIDSKHIMDGESELSAMSHDEADAANAHSDDDVVVVPTPKKRRLGKKKQRAQDTDEEAAEIKPDDAMFTKGSAVKASTLPPAMPTRSTTRASTTGSQDTRRSSQSVEGSQTKNKKGRRTAGVRSAAPNAAVDEPDNVSVESTESNTVSSSGSLAVDVPDSAQQTQSTSPQETVSKSTDDIKTHMEGYVSDMFRTQFAAFTEDFLGRIMPALHQPAVHQPEAVANSSDGSVKRTDSPMFGSAIQEGGTAAPPSTPPRKDQPALINGPGLSKVGTLSGLKAVRSADDNDVETELMPAFKPASLLLARPPTTEGHISSADHNNTRGIFPASPPKSPTKVDLARMFTPKRKNSETSTVHDGPTKSDVPNPESSPSTPKKAKTQEEVEALPINYVPPVACEVYDERLQDEAIKGIYDDLCPLPAGKRLLPSFDRSQPEDQDDRLGGHLGFSTWEDFLDNALIDPVLGQG
ncbi:hypothetical protein R3P38DRAFT_3205701 [Favolaschia claudopus]|uniref:Uncharacterized protein n=1 Tax=Favolaschia claudopus TaxID=2862362 RepID=A0AAW0AMU8_9AGAR